jgi:type IV pilus assembly protein PilQ
VGTSDVSTGTGLPQPPVVGTSGTGSGNGLPLAVNLGAGVPTSGVFFGHRSPNFAVDFFITAAESRGVGKLLSKPRVVTQNNEKAVVKQGTKIPVQTTINNTISITFIDAVLKLEVTPQITAEGTVFMDVLVENTQIDQGIPRVQGTPALDTQSAETKVLVEDGGTVVIGGIIISTQRGDVSQVPIVGSLPVIGRLFKRTNINNQAQELLFFLTPRILPT